MKCLFHFGMASALLALLNLVPADAYASRNTGIAHAHSQTYHDHTPTVHEHGSRPHHG
jgi:hypothetical protein